MNPTPRIACIAALSLAFSTLCAAQTYTGCNGQPATGLLQLSVSSQNNSTGAVQVTGSDSRNPTTPYTWNWGDGAVTQGVFPQSHTYSSIQQNYVLQVNSHENDGSSDCAQLIISFTPIGFGFLPANWQSVGPSNINVSGFGGAGKLQAFAINKANSLSMYAAGGIGPGDSGPNTQTGVYVTGDGGKTWLAANTGLTDPTVNALWMDQSNPQVLLAGTWFQGIFRTTDGGSHWAPASLCSGGTPLGATTAFLLNGNTILAATSQGIAQSTDDGATWCIAQPTASPVRALAGANGYVYAGLDNGQVLIQSTAGGSWTTTQPAQGAVWSLSLNPLNPQICYAVEWNNSAAMDLYVTTNGGQKWNPVPVIGGAPVQYVEVTGSNPSIIFAGQQKALYVSVDGGSTWGNLSSATWDVHLIVTDVVGISGSVVIGTNQGLYLSKNNGLSWTSLNGNMTSSLLHTVSVVNTTFALGAQGFDSVASLDSGTTWSASAWGEGGGSLINPRNNFFVYSYTADGFSYSSDGGKTFNAASLLPGSKFPGNSGNLIAVDPNNALTVYAAGNDGVYMSADSGRSFIREGFSIPASTSLVLVSPTDSKTIYVGTQGLASSLEVSHDGGITWTPSNLNGAAGYPTSIAVDPFNSQNVLLGMSALPPQGGILLSTDGAKTFHAVNNGLDLSYGLVSGAAVSGVGFYPSVQGILGAATWSGLYMSSDMGAHWGNIRGNAVPYLFTDLTWSLDTLYATTAGQGLLKTSTSAAVPVSSISPSSITYGPSGGTGSISVTSLMSATLWAATPSASWITILSGSHGAGNGTVQYSVAANTSTIPRTATILVGGFTFTIVETGVTPTSSVVVSGMTNAASFAKDANGNGSAVAPGSLVSIFGIFPGATYATASGAPFPLTLGGVNVTFDGISAPLSAVVPQGTYGIVNAQVPFEVLAAGQTSSTATLVVTVNGISSTPQVVPIVPAAPGVFTIPPTGQGNAILVFVDPNDGIAKIAAPVSASATIGYPTAPIPAGATGFLYATGLGAMNPTVTDGTADTTVPHFAIANPSVVIGGISFIPSFAGQAPGFPGVNQINIVVPSNAPVGDAIPFQIQTQGGSILSTPGATIAIRAGG